MEGRGGEVASMAGGGKDDEREQVKESGNARDRSG